MCVLDLQVSYEKNDKTFKQKQDNRVNRAGLDTVLIGDVQIVPQVVLLRTSTITTATNGTHVCYRLERSTVFCAAARTAVVAARDRNALSQDVADATKYNLQESVVAHAQEVSLITLFSSLREQFSHQYLSFCYIS